MSNEGVDRSELREIGKRAMRSEIVSRAVILLDEQGFDETTVEEISTAVGISPRSFFRYFPTKEDIAVGHLASMGALVERALAARPDDEPAWIALRAALAPLVSITETDVENVRRSSRVALSTPGLRSKVLELHAAWTDTLAPILSRRLSDDGPHPTMAAEAVTQSAMACLYVATKTWSAGGTRDYADLLDEAFDAVAAL
jgi:AcrR family transcriptional regulator